LYPLKSKEEIHLILGMDDSCNLQCPSCRLEKRDYNKPKNEIEKLQFVTITKLNNRITSLINNYNKEAFITFGASGDAFYSLATVNLISNLKYNPLHRYKFQTNGLSMKAVLPKLKILPCIERISISIDGATKETHEKLRIGSNWSKLIDNIKWLVKLPNRPIIDVNFTVQTDNFREIPLFKEIMDKLGVDEVTYTLYNQWPHITDEIYKKNAVHFPDHINYLEYKDILIEFTKKNNVSRESIQFINPFE
jgi:sulfatase maturation enzyme AslB (radical SAM superfamily)